MDNERREVRFKPAFHRCTDPKGNFGIGGITIEFQLIHGNQGVTWQLLTGMGLPDDDFRAAAPDCDHPRHQDGYPYGLGPTAGPVAWHSPRQMFDFDPVPQGPCEITGGDCWGDVGYLTGDQAYQALARDGEDALWAFLRSMMDREEMQPTHVASGESGE